MVFSCVTTTNKANSYDLLTFLTNKLLTCISIFRLSREPTMTTAQPSEWTNQIRPRYKYILTRMIQTSRRQKKNLFYSIDYIVRNGIAGAYVVIGFVRYTFVMICVFACCVYSLPCMHWWNKHFVSLISFSYITYELNTHMRTYICNRGRK